MKLVTYKNPVGKQSIGWLTKDQGVVDMPRVHSDLPNDMLSFIENSDVYFQLIKDHNLEATAPHYTLSELTLLPPLPNPPSVRDFVGFEQHMLNASKAFGHTIGEVYYDIPVFYFTNHRAIYGPEDEIPRPAKETKLDLELEIAAIIGKRGHDITAEEADDYIFGYTIFNDWTARSIQKQEMQMPLGPAKGKDFANAFGPCIVTKDEFEHLRCEINRETHPEHLRMPLTTKYRFDLPMTAKINGKVICEGNYKTVFWTFPEMIERVSRNKSVPVSRRYIRVRNGRLGFFGGE